MGRKSSIVQLPDAVRDAVDSAVREGRASVDEIAAMIRDMGAAASRSAVGRYVQNANRTMEDYRKAQQLARTWAQQLPENGDVAQLNRQMLQQVAFRVVGDLGDGEEIDTKDVALLAKALKDIASSAKVDVEARAKIRAALIAEQQEKLKKVAQTGIGLSAEQLATIRREVYGIVA